MKLLCKLGIHLDRETIIENRFDVANRIAKDVLVNWEGWSPESYIESTLFGRSSSTRYVSPTCEKAHITEWEIARFLPSESCETSLCFDCGKTVRNYNESKIENKLLILAEKRIKEARRQKLAKSLLEQRN